LDGTFWERGRGQTGRRRRRRAWPLTLSELLVLEVFLQLALQDAAQLLKVFVVQAAVSHQLHALQGARQSGQSVGLSRVHLHNCEIDAVQY